MSEPGFAGLTDYRDKSGGTLFELSWWHPGGCSQGTANPTDEGGKRS